ncbi:MAG TPA: glycosyltransferase family 9 protein, partial [Bacteroidota bacterium]|nr:glycosyltransferase family 9 protein [Bacteroidota bacterium]
EPQSIKRIIIVKLGGLGDVFLSTIVIDDLRRAFPLAGIDYLVEKTGYLAIDGDPRIANIISIDKRSDSPISIIRNVRKNGYDMVIDLFGNPRSAIITLLSGAKHRVGLDYGWRRYCYSIVGTANRAKLHGAEVNLQIFPALGIPVQSPRLRFDLSSEETAYADGFFSANSLTGKFITALMPVGSWQSKRCEPEKFAEIGREVVAKYGAKILIVGGPSDQADAVQIQSLIGAESMIAPAASLRNNIALISRCSAIVANDSGPMHIASSLGVPILCIYGPTFPEGAYGSMHEWVRNEGLECLVCNLLECPIQHQCMRDLPVKRVMEVFERLVRKNGLLVKKDA